MERHGIVGIEFDDALELRLVTPCDAEEIYQVVVENRDHLATFLPWVKHTRSVDDTRAFIRSSLLELADLKSVQYVMLYEGRIIGLIGAMVRYPDTKTYHIGYWVDRAWSGRGFVTRCTGALMEVCFNALGAQKVEILCAVHNHPSNRIPQRLGLVHEGTIRHAAALDDGPADMNIYGMVIAEYRVQIDPSQN